MTERAIIDVQPARAEHGAALVRLFEDADNSCFCQYWQFEQDNRQWQLRCANELEKNRAAFLEQLGAGSIRGLAALHGSEAIGWARLDTPENLHKIYGGRLYRGLPCFAPDRGRVLSLACFLVHPNWRRQGVARQLVAAMKWQAARWQANCLEAFPRGARDVPDEQQFLGPMELLVSEGFEVVHEFAPYPVLRLWLDPTSDRE